jgi:tetratricopeptide (TPR) repeat protein
MTRAGAPAAAIVVLAATAAAARPPIDEQELAALARKDPSGVERIERGEALAARGALGEAESLFAEVAAAHPEASLAWRRDCEALTALGKRPLATAACTRAVQASHSNANLRAFVDALVAGPTRPSATELYQALAITAHEHEMAPASPTSLAMECDIAEHIGDEAMLARSSMELSRIAPDDPEAIRARAVLQARCPPLRFWAGWSAIFASSAATVLAALRRRSRRAAAALGVATACALSLLGAVARAQEPVPHFLSSWPVDDEHPEAHIPSERDRNSDPLNFGYWLQDVGLKARLASKRGDHASSVKFYATLVQAVPDRAFGLLMMCDEYQAMGDHDRAVHACGQALLRVGAAEVTELGQVLAHMKTDPAGRGAYDHLACEVAVRTKNLTLLDQCTGALALASPDDVQTVSYEFARAMLRGDLDEASRIAARARALAFPPDTVARMEGTVSAARRWGQVRAVAALLAALLFTAIAVWVARSWSRRRRNGGEASPPPPPAALSPS